jgi:hypothetical protein
MQKLVEGVHTFQEKIFRSYQEFFTRLANGQSPEALFITCSDSRIDPNLLTQTRPGDLFIVRNAGNLVPAYGAVHGGEAATIEYALTILGVRRARSSRTTPAPNSSNPSWERRARSILERTSPLAALLENHVIDPVARWHQYRACQTNNRPSAG